MKHGIIISVVGSRTHKRVVARQRACFHRSANNALTAKAIGLRQPLRPTFAAVNTSVKVFKLIPTCQLIKVAWIFHHLAYCLLATRVTCVHSKHRELPRFLSDKFIIKNWSYSREIEPCQPHNQQR